MRTLIVINDAPYGTERMYNAIRLAQALLKSDPDAELTVFLMADAVTAARGQTTPEGYMAHRLGLQGQLHQRHNHRVQGHRDSMTAGMPAPGR